jgi:hypothetical protein
LVSEPISEAISVDSAALSGDGEQGFAKFREHELAS